MCSSASGCRWSGTRRRCNSSRPGWAGRSRCCRDRGTAVIDVLVVGDEFIPAASYEDAFASVPEAAALVSLRTVPLGGAKAEQHAAQQVMERAGAGAVPAPASLLDALDGAEALCVHFAPVGADLLARGPALRVVAVARSGLANVDVAASTKR